MTQFNVEKVMRVYSGKPGCACGCNGIYRTNPQYIEEAGKDRGYPIQADELNMTQVKKITKLFNENIALVEEITPNELYSLDLNNRTYSLILVKEA
jgi:hypothetical protein